MALNKNKRVKCKKLTEFARGRDCQARIPGICNFDNSTSVFAHLGGAGWALKNHDFQGTIACSRCHDWLDGGFLRCETMKDYRTDVAIHIRNSFMLQGMAKTQCIMLDAELLKVKNYDK
jgi:hypothetical protein